MAFVLKLIRFYSGYNSLLTFGISKEQINSIATPYIVLSVLYFIAFFLCIFLIVKKRYLISIIVSAKMLVVYIVILILR
jgi:hypothetical protein